MPVLDHNLLVIGGGLARLRAAEVASANGAGVILRHGHDRVGRGIVGQEDRACCPNQPDGKIKVLKAVAIAVMAGCSSYSRRPSPRSGSHIGENGKGRLRNFGADPSGKLVDQSEWKMTPPRQQDRVTTLLP